MTFETFDRRHQFEKRFYTQLDLIRIHLEWLSYKYRN
jgi:hypothetical protein